MSLLFLLFFSFLFCFRLPSLLALRRDLETPSNVISGSSSEKRVSPFLLFHVSLSLSLPPLFADEIANIFLTSLTRSKR